MEWSGLKRKDFQLFVCMKGHSSQLTEGSVPSHHPGMSLPVLSQWDIAGVEWDYPAPLPPPLTALYCWPWGKDSCRMGPAEISPGVSSPWPRPGLYIQGEELGDDNDIPNSHPLVGDVVSAVREISPLASEGITMSNYMRFPILLIEMAELIKYLCPKCHVYKMIISFSVVCTS